MRIADYIVSRGCMILPGAREPRLIFRALFAPSAMGKRRLFGASKRLEGEQAAWEPGEEVFDALCASLKTTDLGNGVALPHVRLDSLPSPRLYVVSLPDGLPGRDVDSPLLRLLFVFLTPTGQPDIHLQLLAHLGWLAGLEGLLSATASCREPDELVSALLKVEASGQGGFISLDRNAVFEELKTAEGGLSTEEARRRIEITGPNLIRRPRGTPTIVKLGKNFVSVFAILLWAAGGLCFIPGVDMPQLGWAIFAVILINAFFSFWQESKAEKAVEALQRLIPRDCLALRDGQKVRIPAADLVFGDVVYLEEGDRIPVDARLIEADGLQVNNATLTGESRPIYKTAEPIPGNDEVWFLWTELPNMVFAGTSVTAGSGAAVVMGTAMGTEIGRIATLTQSVREEESPLQKEIKKLVNLLTLLSIGIGLLFFFLGTGLGGLSFIEAFIFTIGITVANIPEGLLPTMSLALAMGVQRMAKRQVLVKNLASVETLGSTTVICTDKTGTLTTNRISVVRLIVGLSETAIPETLAGKQPVDPAIRELLQVATLCNNARPGLGDPTEGALLDLADRYAYDWTAEQAASPRLSSFPFESVRKRMSTLHRDKDGAVYACVKGSPLELLSCCATILEGGAVRPLTEGDRARIRADVDGLATEGLRTLAFARKELGEGALGAAPTMEEVESGLCFLGITGMEDPARPEVPAAVASCREAGIRIIMVTGDYGLTAVSIARHIGMIGPEEKAQDCLVSGQDLAKLDDESLKRRLGGKGSLIFARVNPEQKMRVVSALKEMGEVVAVTGDGVNDAAALKKADIGIAMGREVNDVAKEAASMLVLDGNFASIVHAVEEGRAVYANIRRFSTYVLASNMPELAPFILFVLFKMPLALTVMQILAIDLGTDLVPALGLGAEAPEPGIMRRAPRSRKERIVNGKVLARAYLWQGGLEILLSLVAFFHAYAVRGFAFGSSLPMSGPVYRFATTLTLAGIVACQIGNVFGCRTSHESIFKVGFASNRLVLLGIGVEICLIVCLVYIPFFQGVFSLVPLGIGDWAFIAVFPFIMLGAEEARKWLVRRGESRRAV
jgi:P-type Ca2+ transporter type 2C